MSLRERAAREVKWAFVASWGRQALSVVIYAVLARLLSPSEFGLVALTTVYVALMNIFVNQGLGMALIQRKDMRKEHVDAAFWLAIGSGTAIALATVVAAPLVSELLGDQALVPIVIAMAPAFLLSALANVQLALKRKEMEFRFLAMQSLLSTLVAGACGIVLACLGAGVWSLVTQTLVSALTTVALCWFTRGWRPSFKLDFAPLRELFGVSGKVMLGNCLAFVSQQFDRLVLGRDLGAATLGVYAVGTRVGSLLSDAIQSPIADVALPAFAKIETAYRVGPSVAGAVELSNALTLPIATFVYLYADVLIPTVFGPQWAAAAPVLRFAAVGFAIMGVCNFTWSVLMARGRTGLCLALTAIDAAACAVAALIGVRYGAAGVAAAVTGRTAFCGAVGMLMLRSSLKVPLRLVCAAILRAVPATAAVAGTIALSDLVLGKGLASAVAAAVVGVPIYFLVLHLTARSTFMALRDSVFAAIGRSGAAAAAPPGAQR